MRAQVRSARAALASSNAAAQTLKDRTAQTLLDIQAEIDAIGFDIEVHRRAVDENRNQMAPEAEGLELAVIPGSDAEHTSLVFNATTRSVLSSQQEALVNAASGGGGDCGSVAVSVPHNLHELVDWLQRNTFPCRNHGGQGS